MGNQFPADCVIIGTAGHIDHGKTALVKALTGVDTDRLPEEKRRGITIELGFAPLHLEGVGLAGVVDVPGHEAFVRTMVAGATGIDVALLVVAADEGVMPQTTEHIEILNLLGTHAGVVALTKCDLVDEDWLGLVTADVETALRGTVLEGAPIVRTSATTGAGIATLKGALAAAGRSRPDRDASDLFRMPIDRVFSVRGTGTVVTGTTWSGTIHSGGTALLQPSGRTVRVRGVQVHGHDVDSAGPATRAAIALANVDVSDVARGSWLVEGTHWTPSLTMRATVSLLDGEAPLRPREWLRFHLGTADVAARVVAPGGAIAPGERRAVRIVLQEPIIARAGDRFVLRRASPPATIGGGSIVDPMPTHRRLRPFPLDVENPVDRLELLVDEAGRLGTLLTTLPVRLGVHPSQIDAFIALSKGLTRVGDRLFSSAELREVETALGDLVDQFHATHPLEEGVDIAKARAQLLASEQLADRALESILSRGDVELRGTLLARPSWRPRLTEDQQSQRATLLAELREAASEPPSVSFLSEKHGGDVQPLLRLLERDGLVVAVESDRYFAQEAVQELIRRLQTAMNDGREYSPTDLRDVLGISRKYLIPFLEFCDKRRITERRTTGRVLHAH